MLIRKASDIPSAEITPKEVYLNRRSFMTGIGSVLAASAARLNDVAGQDDRKLQFVGSPLSTHGETLTKLEHITSYNNFYEFGVDKGDPARNAASLSPRPWSVKIDGHVKNPRTYDVDQLLKMHPSLEERVYRLRCVEAWSMVIPWIGIPLNSVVKAVEPTSKARYLAFETLYNPIQMPGQKRPVIQWPYVEGLRMDEAMHPLTLLAVGLYGEVLPNQNGAPIRLVVPWKYGFKSIKSIVRMRFVEKQPPTSWSMENPREYGFYANVNPEVDHPRWSQSKERRIGEFFRRDTLMFNGYADQVASLYAGMDLQKYY